MPRLVRQMLQEKVSALPAVRLFLEDFRRVSGLDAELLDALGHPIPSLARQTCAPFCAYIQGTVQGCSACNAQKQMLLERATSGLATLRCEFGLREVAVPIRVAGQAVAYLRFGGFFNEAPDLSALNGIRHLCERAGGAAGADSASMLAATRVVPRELEDAYLRWMQLAAAQIAHQLTHHELEGDPLPAALQRALEEIRGRCSEPLSLSAVAKRAGVSPAHLCRLFQQRTGLRFRDYLAKARLTRARDLLVDSTLSITEICFTAGFQSVSAFNRSFRSSEGLSPKEFRARQTQAA